MVYRSDQDSVYFIEESAYGASPVTALSFVGDIVRLQPKDFRSQGFAGKAGYTTFKRPYQGAAICGAQLQFNPWGTGYTDILKFIMGTDAGSFRDNLANVYSFSLEAGRGSTLTTDLYNGCMLNQLKMTAQISNDQSNPWMFDCDVFNQYIQGDNGTAKIYVGLQSLTIGANPSVPTTDPILYNGTLKYDYDAALDASPSYTTIEAQSVDITLHRNIKRVLGEVTGDDAAIYNVSKSMIPRGKEDAIVLRATLIEEDEAHIDAFRAGEYAYAQIVLGAKTLTFANGTIMREPIAPTQENKSEKGVTLEMRYADVVTS